MAISERFDNIEFSVERTITKTAHQGSAHIAYIHATFVTFQSIVLTCKASVCCGPLKFRNCVTILAAYNERPLALKCVQSFLKWKIEAGHTSIEYTLNTTADFEHRRLMSATRDS